MLKKGKAKETTLRTYANILKDCAFGHMTLEKKGRYKQIDNTLLALKKEGLIFFPDEAERSDLYGSAISEESTVDITPKGAIALVEWDNFIRENTWWYICFKNMGRFLWVIVGALAASLLDIIKLILK